MTWGGNGATTAVAIAIIALCALSVLPAEQQPPPAPGRAGLAAQDYIEIQQLVRKYAWALDGGDNYGYAYADLFTPDGVFVGMNQGPKGGRTRDATCWRGWRALRRVDRPISVISR
jgi:hypothetical protein